MSEKDKYVHIMEAAPFSWLVRPCDYYWEERTHCKTMRSRFYQYYIDGKIADCSHWKERAKLCDKWESQEDKDALLLLIEMEKQRYANRMSPHLANDVWERRKEPPKDWIRKLPESHEKRIEESFLKQLVENESQSTSYCVIL